MSDSSRSHGLYTPCSLYSTVSQILLRFMSIESVILSISSSFIPFSSHLQSFSALVFSNEPVLHIRWPEYWSFSFHISPSNEYSGLISFRIDWLVLLVVQGTLKGLLQHHSSKISILQHSAFFIVQRSHPTVQFSSFQFSRSVVSDSLGPHELQHARPPCPSPSPGVHSESQPSSP